ncbi:MAG: outer membrane beta-barrel protein [Chitinophagales bacterium]|nr:outer membrane beta-barrel protein [Chitinophagales bacterium]
MKKVIIILCVLLMGVAVHAQTGEEGKVSVTITRADGTTYTIEAPDMETLQELLEELDIEGDTDDIADDLEQLNDLEMENMDITVEADTLAVDSTSLKVGKWKIVVKEKGDGTDNVDFSIGVDEGEYEPEEEDDRDIDNFQTDWFLLSLGYNTFVDADYKVNAPIPYEPLTDLHFWGSADVNLDIFRSRINFGAGYVNFNYGIALESHHYRFNQNFTILPDLDTLTLNTETIAYDKNKFNTTHICLPLSLGFETKPWDTDNSFRIAFGYNPGIHIKGKTKHKIDGNSDVEKDDFNVEDFRQEVNAMIGVGKFNLYASYDLTSMFKEGEGPELHPVSVGIIIRRGFEE